MYPVWDVVPRDLQPGRDCTFRVKPLPLNKGGGLEEFGITWLGGGGEPQMKDLGGTGIQEFKR